MIKETQIRDRFMDCLKEATLTNTYDEIADSIGTSKSYLSQVKKKPNIKIRPGIIAKFCIKYRYSVEYILTGKGERKRGKTETEKELLIKLVHRLMDEILEGKPRKNIDLLMKQIVKN